MYDSNVAVTAASAGGTLAMTAGMAASSWILVAIAVIAIGAAIWGLGVRIQKRKGAKP